MSSAKSPHEKEPATLHSTRQMLDELDALMDRMLALPVNDLDDAALPRDVVRMPNLSATLTVLESFDQEEETSPSALPPPPREIHPGYTTDPSSASAAAGARPLLMEPSFLEQLPRQGPVPELAPIPEEMIPPSITTLPGPPATPTRPVKLLRRPRRTLLSRTLFPLLWFNQGFDAGTIILGSPGRWLRGPNGRHFLGLTGLAFLALTGLWLVKDWLGWTW